MKALVESPGMGCLFVPLTLQSLILLSQGVVLKPFAGSSSPLGGQGRQLLQHLLLKVSSIPSVVLVHRDGGLWQTAVILRGHVLQRHHLAQTVS